MIASAIPRTRHSLALRLQCRKEWVEGQGTLAQVANRHSVPSSTLIAWYRREKWSAARSRWLEKQLSDSETPIKPPAYPPNSLISRDGPHARAIERLVYQLEALDNALDAAKSPEDWHKLCFQSRFENVECRCQHIFRLGACGASCWPESYGAFVRFSILLNKVSRAGYCLSPTRLRKAFLTWLIARLRFSNSFGALRSVI